MNRTPLRGREKYKVFPTGSQIAVGRFVLSLPTVISAFAVSVKDVRERAARIKGSDSTPVQNAPCFAVCALACDFSRRAECVPTFVCESERGPFVPEVLKTV